jgi:hypothetical protein
MVSWSSILIASRYTFLPWYKKIAWNLFQIFPLNFINFVYNYRLEVNRLDDIVGDRRIERPTYWLFDNNIKELTRFEV